MTRLNEWIASQSKHQCDLCGVALMMSLINFGLMIALNWERS
jgi:hypothetical protein